MASYDIGGHLSAGGFATGLEELGGWVSLGDATMWTGNILSHSQECLDNGAYIGYTDHRTFPENIIPLAEFPLTNETVHLGWIGDLYDDETPEIMQLGFVLSKDGTWDTQYSIILWAPPMEMKEGAEYCYMAMYLYSDPNNNILSMYFGMRNAWDASDVYTMADAIEHMPDKLAPCFSMAIEDSQGNKLSEDDLQFEPDSSTPSMGGGDYDNDSDVIPVPALPTLGAYNSGLLSVYNPSLSELHNFANFLWSNDVFDTIKKFIASPMELIVSLSIVPVDPPAGESATIKIGGISTGIGSTLIANQYINVNCGTLNIKEYFGSALDYGYTRISVYLPFIGVREVKASEVMSGAINIQYNIDLVSGSCVAFIVCARQGLNAVLYSFEGNIASQIPIMSRDFSGIYTALARGVVDSTLKGTGIIGSAYQSAMSVMSNSPTTARAGNFSANAGLLGVHRPYVIIERPIQSDPADSNKFYGRPSNITATLGTLTGYTEVEEVFLDGLACTDEERELVRSALEEGTIF